MNRLKFRAAVANSGAMEADTISKNGRSSKSQMSRGNFLSIISSLAIVAIIGLSMISCGGGSSNSNNSSGNSSNSSKIPSGTYVFVKNEKTTITFFSENKLIKSDNFGWWAHSGEFTYTIIDDIINCFDENKRFSHKMEYVLDEGTLIIQGGTSFHNDKCVFVKK